MHRVHIAHTDEALRAVQQLRYQVYTDEMKLYRDQADASARVLTDAHDATGIQLLGTTAGEPVGTVRIHVGPLPAAWHADLDLDIFAEDVPPERIAFGSRLTVLPSHRGSPIVQQIIEAAVEQSLRAGCDLLVLDCVPHLLNLYESLGWRRYTRRTLRDPDTGVLVPMALVLRDRAHLARQRSPFLALLDRLEPEAEAPPWVTRYFDAHASRMVRGGEGWPELYAAMAPVPGLFAGIGEDDVARLLERSHELDLQPDHVFVIEGTVYRSLFVLLEGSVEVLLDRAVVRQLGRGEVLGEIAWLLGTERSASVRASASGARILALNERTLKSTMASHPVIGMRLMQNLARTLAARLISVTGFEKPAGAP